MSDLVLGKNIQYPESYDPSLLYPISRKNSRDTIQNNHNLKFYGVDIWNCYEISFLDHNKIPVVLIGEIIVPAESEFIVESKSLKLYLNSFNNMIFSSNDQVRELIIKDLSNILKCKIQVNLNKLDYFYNSKLVYFENSISIDNYSEEIPKIYSDPKSEILSIEDNKIVKESLFSDLLKSNCLVTSQPDWASVQINYEGNKINRSSLLSYILSFRNHNEFHEHCVERIFCDIIEAINPSYLSVYARYTRRGGIDINPFRTMSQENLMNLKNFRFVRQ